MVWGEGVDKSESQQSWSLFGKVDIPISTKIVLFTVLAKPPLDESDHLGRLVISPPKQVYHVLEVIPIHVRGGSFQQKETSFGPGPWRKFGFQLKCMDVYVGDKTDSPRKVVTFRPAFSSPCWYPEVPAEAVDRLSKISTMVDALEVSKASSDSDRHSSVPCDYVLVQQQQACVFFRETMKSASTPISSNSQSDRPQYTLRERYKASNYPILEYPTPWAVVLLYPWRSSGGSVID